MKLLRVEHRDHIIPATFDSELRLRSLAQVITDIDAASIGSDSLGRLRAVMLGSLPLLPPQLPIAPCVAGIGKIVCVGLNFHDHAREAGMPVPAEPVLFLKATSAIAAPNAPLHLPRGSTRTDWEVELGVVIGKTARHVSCDTALQHVAGYCVVNDYSERSFQLERGGQWSKGKSADGFAPIGPWLVTPDEVPDPQSLELWLEVNGERKQHGRSGDMIFAVDQLISYVSEFMTLHPGDVLCTGTPAGVGLGQRPPQFLRAGDVVRLGITGLGQQEQQIRPPL